MAKATFKIWRGDPNGGAFKNYTVEYGEGTVVLDCVHQIQATQAGDLACRWNCKAGKCGSCSAEINGKPRLMCMTRMDTVPTGEPITLQPMKTFPLIKDLVTDVSWNYKINKQIPPFKPRPPDAPDGTGEARLGARVRPGHFSQTHDRPELLAKTLVEVLWRGDDHRSGDLQLLLLGRGHAAISSTANKPSRMKSEASFAFISV